MVLVIKNGQIAFETNLVEQESDQAIYHLNGVRDGFEKRTSTTF